MKRVWVSFLKVTLLLLLAGMRALAQGQVAVSLPEGVTAVWDVDRAYRETTPTREKICINGLWRWQPASTATVGETTEVPVKDWGYFKVPGCWPGITDYMQKDSQTLHVHPSWKNTRLNGVMTAWYERTVSIPEHWRQRRIALAVEYLNSYAMVFVDGKKRGEILFPGGELDLTGHLVPGRTHLLTLQVVSMPLKGVLLSYTDSNSARESKGKVERRGLCGDVFLVSTSPGPRIMDLRIDTSVRKSEITLSTELRGLLPADAYSLRCQVTQGGSVIREFVSHSFAGRSIGSGPFIFSQPWRPEALWDIHTPTNQYEAILTLTDAQGRTLDTQFNVRFGFREFWIEGRDFYLNGSRIFLCALPLDNAQVGAALASYEGARESLARLRSIGINCVYTHNYGCEPGAHLGFTEILRAADDVGMLVSLSQPHFSHYDWKERDSDQNNGYARHAAFYVRAAQNHPAVVAYAMSHNATGYEEDMNPDLIDGLHDSRDKWSSNNSKLALRAEAIVKRLDPVRTIYHHASGNLSSMHVINFYPNFVPIQELCDWFEHWGTRGVKPVFTCEYGAPFTWDWTMYRGWYKGQREFGSAEVPWEFCLAEWNAQFFGDVAFRISDAEAANLRWEAKQLRAGKTWHRWDYPQEVSSTSFDERYPVFAKYLTDNWRAFRTWGVSGISPWEHEHFWRLRPKVDRQRQNLKVDWVSLQRPGFSPDYLDKTYERMDLAYERADWEATPAAEALLRNNRPLLAYIGGKSDRFTSKDHVFYPGETVEKQLILINNSREPVSAEADWSFALPRPVPGHQTASIKTGDQERIPLLCPLPENLPPGSYEVRAQVRFSKDDTQTDSFLIQVLPRPQPVTLNKRLALFDPKKETSEQLKRMGVSFQAVSAESSLAAFDILVVGKGALTPDGPTPDITRVRDGLKVLVFEQTSAALERRLGFRTAEYGLRQVFVRVPEHPALAGIATEAWRDWRGDATILAPRLAYTLRPRYGPTINWCDIPVPHLWRCGNRGNVASVLIEKPARGDFLPIIDGGYGLQYSPLLEYREGRGMILFCQLDVTGRTEPEPAAETFSRNVLSYVAGWSPAPSRTAVYIGDPAGKRHLESAGFSVAPYHGGKIGSDQVLVIGPDADSRLTANPGAMADWTKAGGRRLALGVDLSTANALLPNLIAGKKQEHISTFFEPPERHSVFAGVGPADVHNRDPRELTLITAGVPILGNGVLAAAPDASTVFCQLVPWQFEPYNRPNLKRTYRRTSFLVTRLLSNLGVVSSTPMLARFQRPDATGSERRWRNGFYLDPPEEWDYPYRFFRW